MITHWIIPYNIFYAKTTLGTTVRVVCCARGGAGGGGGGGGGKKKQQLGVHAGGNRTNLKKLKKKKIKK